MNMQDALKKIKLSKNFTAYEFCNTMDKYAIVVPDITLFEKLQKLRDIVGSIEITSGYRTPTFNKKVGGSTNSYHTKGLAADIKFNFEGWDIDKLRKIMIAIGFGNVGFYIDTKTQKFAWIHCDIGKPWNSTRGWIRHTKEYSDKVYYV